MKNLHHEDHVKDIIDIENSALHNEEIINSFTPEEQKKIIRRVDIRLVVTMGCLFIVSLLDRTNLGAASVAGMQKELDMNASNNGYSITSLVFFVTYTLFQIPTTVIIRTLGPRIFLAGIVTLWGGVMIGFGFVKNWESMAGLRAILGGLEAGLFPGSVYLLSTWYPRYGLQKRNSAFFLIGSVASGFGGILAYGLSQMDGLGGLSGWRWIFIIEGLLTCVLGLGSYILLVDFPDKAPNSWKFLNQTEVSFIITTIEHDRADTTLEPFSLRKYLANGKDSKVWAYAILYMLVTMPSYAIAYFLPIILQESMHFSVVKAQCLVAPPYVFAGVVMYIQAVYSDKWRLRGPIIVGNALVVILGLALLGFLKNPAPRYFGVFLATAAANANCPAIVSWQSNNIRGQWKRAFTSATSIGGGSMGGIIATTVFRAQDAPDYISGLIAAILANGLIVVVAGLLTLKYNRANKRVDAGGKPIEGKIGFKYTY
ncbi:Major facilitator superfamily domain general substrate transporter [Penicillium crustosum]|uniref:Major facilitator superfamily domain general substrate transporter n=1 Tax=Penicillium crustosum TaxID=36656 RepID=UPI00238437ED|nr:Major facilitator superfamily domain general substrate transporter [Penicillium crustosum]KAJ5394801.1 Major facilitator superfamily domain general substrate transporter [Penicillium crustosum]